MNKFTILLAAPLAAFAFAGPAHALEYVYPNGEVTTRPLLDNPMPTVSDQVRATDLRLGDCLKANGGRMVPRCAALRDASASIARMQNDTAMRQGSDSDDVN